MAIEELSQKPELVFFDSVAFEDDKSLIIVRRDGSFTEILETSGKYSPVEVHICSVPVVSARQMLFKGMMHAIFHSYYIELTLILLL